MLSTTKMFPGNNNSKALMRAGLGYTRHFRIRRVEAAKASGGGGRRARPTTRCDMMFLPAPQRNSCPIQTSSSPVTFHAHLHHHRGHVRSICLTTSSLSTVCKATTANSECMILFLSETMNPHEDDAICDRGFLTQCSALARLLTLRPKSRMRPAWTPLAQWNQEDENLP